MELRSLNLVTACVVIVSMMMARCDAVDCYSCVSTNYVKGDDTCLENSLNEDDAPLLTNCDCCRKAVSDSGVQRDCVRLERYVNHLTRDERRNRYCTDNPGEGNYICKTDKCNAAFSLTATHSLVVVASAIVMTSFIYYALW